MPKRDPRSQVQQALEAQRKEFIKKFGREPGPNDPLLFDPDADTPQSYPEERLRQEMVEAMLEAEMPGHLIYAYSKTGLLVNEHGYRNMSSADRREYDAAIAEYHKMTPEQQKEGVKAA
jgi:hypothetical protein